MFLSDQGRDAIIMKNIMTGVHLPAIGASSSIGQVYLGPFYYYLIAPFLLLFNFNPVGMSYGVVFLSLIGMIVAYWIIKKEFGNLTSFVFLVLITFSSTNIEMSRFSWNPNLLPCFSFFTLYLFYKMVQKQKIIYAILFGTFFGLSIQLHYLAALLILPISIYFIYSLLVEKNKLKQILHVTISIISFIIISSPLLIFDFRHNFINSNNFLKLFSQGGVFGNSSISSRFNDVLLNAFANIFSIQYSLFFVIIIGILFIIWLLLLNREKNNKFMILNILNIILFLIGFSLINSSRFPHYYSQIYLSVYLILAILFTNLKELLPKYWVIILFLFLIGYIGINLPQYYFLSKLGTDQIVHAQKVAEFLAPIIGNKPYNIATWPVELTEDNYVYFLELKGLTPADRTKIEITNQMFVLCNQKPCKILDSPSWNISMFGKAKIDKIWEVEGITIYKLIHIEDRE
jgi:4-amino-4-deoxy-L-arabinose transferase-like glycosyltransferase